jgi:hypothetical protein
MPGVEVRRAALEARAADAIDFGREALTVSEFPSPAGQTTSRCTWRWRPTRIASGSSSDAAEAATGTSGPTGARRDTAEQA